MKYRIAAFCAIVAVVALMLFGNDGVTLSNVPLPGTLGVLGLGLVGLGMVRRRQPL